MNFAGGKIFVKSTRAAYFWTSIRKAIRLFFHKWRFFCQLSQAADLPLIKVDLCRTLYCKVVKCVTFKVESFLFVIEKVEMGIIN